MHRKVKPTTPVAKLRTEAAKAERKKEQMGTRQASREPPTNPRLIPHNSISKPNSAQKKTPSSKSSRTPTPHGKTSPNR